MGLEITAPELHPTDAGYAQLVIPHLHALGDGEAILPVKLAFEGGVRALAPEERRVGICQIFQDIAHFGASVRLQPSGLRIPPQGRELLVHAKAGRTGPVADAKLLPAAIRMGLARQEVIPDKTAGSRRAGHLVGHGARPRQKPQPHTAVDYFTLCYIGRIRHGTAIPCL